MNLSAEQRTVAVGMGAAFVVSGLVLWAAWAFAHPLATDRFAAFASAVAVAALAPLVMVGWIARHRFFSAAIDGARPPDDAGLAIDVRVLNNTVEQTILASAAYGLLAVRLPVERLGLLIWLPMWFLVARLTFWIGYHRAPASRAFGFAATFYPTVMLMIIGWLAGW